jgi:hypothetical protein
MKQLLDSLLRGELNGLLGTCFLLVATLISARTKRWLAEHLARESRRSDEALRKLAIELSEIHFRQHGQTLKTLSEASETAEPLTLDDLRNRADRDFTLRSSETQSQELDDSPTLVIPSRETPSPPLSIYKPFPPSKR